MNPNDIKVKLILRSNSATQNKQVTYLKGSQGKILVESAGMLDYR